MLLPSRATVEAALARIPKGNLITTDLLRSKLAHQFGVEVTCPATMQTALRAIARDATGIPFWRVVKRNGELMSIFPGGAANHAKLLRREGFKIDAKGKVPEVHEFAQSLMSFVI